MESQEKGTQNPNQLSRRKLIKLLTGTGGAVAASALVPAKWVSPVVKTGVVPVHAVATSHPTPNLGTGDLQITLT